MALSPPPLDPREVQAHVKEKHAPPPDTIKGTHCAVPPVPAGRLGMWVARAVEQGLGVHRPQHSYPLPLIQLCAPLRRVYHSPRLLKALCRRVTPQCQDGHEWMRWVHCGPTPLL